MGTRTTCINTAAGLHVKDIYVLCASFQVTEETPAFSVKVTAHLDYLAPRALKEIEVSEQWSHSNEMEVSGNHIYDVIAQKPLGL